MNPARRAAYLRALGVEVWVPKTAAGEAPSRAQLSGLDASIPAGNEATPARSVAEFFVQAGTSDTLLLCLNRTEAETLLARDISLSLKSEPVWAWPISDAPAGSITLKQTIQDRLITRLIVFGKDLATAAGEGNGNVVGMADMLRVESLAELAKNGEARRALWEALDARQWCGTRARVLARSAGA